ncbi:MAG: hypothetical protein FK733_03900 [Asgard group archaeon]|nr:hypothetical protein [Asgard group archaeon]
MVFRRRREGKKVAKKTVPDETKIIPEPEEPSIEAIPDLDEPAEPVTIAEEVEPTLDDTTETVIDTFGEEETPTEAPIVETMPEAEEVDDEPKDDVTVEELTDELVKTEEELTEEIPDIVEPIDEPIIEPTTDEIIDLSLESEEDIIEEPQEFVEDKFEEELVTETIEEPSEPITESEPPIMTPLTADEADIPEVPPVEETIDEIPMEEEVITVIKEADEEIPTPEIPDLDEPIVEEQVTEEPIIETEPIEVSEPKEEMFTHPDSNVKVSEFLKEKDTIEIIEEPEEPEEQEPLEEIELTMKVPKELYNFLKSVLQLFEWSYEDSKQYLNYLLLDSIEEAIKNNFGQVPDSDKLINKLDKIIEDFKKQL